MPAHVIGLLYQQRWQVELFFRWIKTIANFNHLISHTRQGMLLQMYTIIIGVMLMYLHTGYRPSKYLFALLSSGASAGTRTTLCLRPGLRPSSSREKTSRKIKGRSRLCDSPA